MADRVVLNVEVDEDLSAYVAANVGEDGRYDTVGDYVRDLIRQDQEQAKVRFQALKAHLQKAFAAPESDYLSVTAEDVIARGRARRGL